MPFETIAKMILIMQKPKTYAEFVKAMHEARPDLQDPKLLKAAWANR